MRFSGVLFFFYVILGLHTDFRNVTQRKSEKALYVNACVCVYIYIYTVYAGI